MIAEKLVIAGGTMTGDPSCRASIFVALAISEHAGLFCFNCKLQTGLASELDFIVREVSQRHEQCMKRFENSMQRRGMRVDGVSKDSRGYMLSCVICHLKGLDRQNDMK